MENSTKECTKCGQIKARSQFSRSTELIKDLTNQCNICGNYAPLVADEIPKEAEEDFDYTEPYKCIRRT